jgi:hypothetical protein
MENEMTKLLLALFASVCLMFGQVEVASSTKHDKELFRIQKVVRKYQHKFMMDSIVIGVDVVEIKTLPVGSCGASLWRVSADGGFGTILVLRADQYNKTDTCKTSNVRKDQENTVVHEMGHFVYRYANEEMAITAFSNVIVPYHPVKEKKKKATKPVAPVVQDPVFDDYPSRKNY